MAVARLESYFVVGSLDLTWWPDLTWPWVEILTKVAEKMGGGGGKVGENPAALRAGVFSLSSKTLRGGGAFKRPPAGRGLTHNRLGGGGGVFHPPRFFRNNSWTLADIDMKLGMPLRTSILRRLAQKSDSGNKILRYSRFCDVTSRDFGAKKINVWKFIKNTFVKRIARKLHKR